MAKQGEQRVTIKRIAEEAGVSLPTVSKVLNGRTDVSAATRTLVEEVMRAHGYQRRPAKPSPTSKMVDLVFHELDSQWAVELIRGVEAEANRRGAEVVLSECGGARTPRQAWIDSVLSRRPAGVVMVMSDLAPDQRAQLEARNIPCVVVDPAGEVPEGVVAIGSSNFQGGRAATKHLLGLGHRRIGVIGGPADTLASRMRVAGYTDALIRAGIEVDNALIRTGTFRVESGRAGASALMELPDPPTAIFAGSDLHAIGVYQAAHDRGLALPRELSVVGYDDLPAAGWLRPALTTIHQPLFEMAELATRVVLDRADGQAATPSPSLELAVHLVERDSAAPLE